MKVYVLFFLYLANLVINEVKSASVCDLNLEQIVNWSPASIPQLTVNTRLENAVGDFVLVNSTTSISQCVRSCCEKVDCNFAYLKESKMCYMITCLSDEQCQVVVNKEKEARRRTEPVDIMIRVRSVDESNKLAEMLSKEKAELARIEQTLVNKPCSPSHSGSCPSSEFCLLNKQTSAYQCVCPSQFNFYRLNGLCREYLPNQAGCMLNLRQCPENEECLGFYEHQRQHGTCQCKFGLVRSVKTHQCELLNTDAYPQAASEPVKPTSRRRPSPPVFSPLDDKESTESELLQEIINELGPVVSTTPPVTLSTSTTTSTTTTTQTTTTTEVSGIYTNNLRANAGDDIEVWYPARSCLLNGTRSQFLTSSRANSIVKFVWEKHDSSPAFGRFTWGKEGAIVSYENMISGTYIFILKVWTNTNEFSQDVVKVHVHSVPLGDGPAASKPISWSQHSSSLTAHLVENLIQVELNIRPDLFSESMKNQFIGRLEVWLKQQFAHNKQLTLTKPKIYVINTRVVTNSRYTNKSNVIIELVIVDLGDVKEDQTTSENQIDLTRLVKSDLVVRELRKKQRYLKFSVINSSLNSMLKSLDLDKYNAYLDSLLKSVQKSVSSAIEPQQPQQRLEEFLNIEISSASQVTCLSSNEWTRQSKNNTISRLTCSNHGQCDLYSLRCVCDKYYMYNMFSYYLFFDSDLTEGNNCDLNIPVMVVCTLLGILGVLILLVIIFKYFLYYLCCCCICCGRKNRKLTRANRFRIRDESYFADDNDNDEDDDNDSGLGSSTNKSLFGKKKKGFLANLKLTGSKSSKKHKYSLLRDQDDEKSLLHDREEIPMSRKNGYNDEEDILFDKVLLNNSAASVKDHSTIKKYNQLI